MEIGERLAIEGFARENGIVWYPTRVKGLIELGERAGQRAQATDANQ